MIKLEGKHCKDCKIFIDEVEDSTLALVEDIINNPAFDNSKIRLMPDCHTGKSICIGFTAPLTNFVNPNHVGVDIGCTIDVYTTNVPTTSINLVKLESDIRKYVKFGRDINERNRADKKDFYKFLQRYMDKCRSSWPEMIQPVKVNDQYIADLCWKIKEDLKTFWCSLGSCGGGNHFIEISDNQGFIAYTVHCGSRHFGLKVAKYHSEKTTAKGLLKSEEFKVGKEAIITEYESTGRLGELNEALKKYKLEFKSKNPEGYLSGDNMSEYLTDMAVATAYAQYNHKILSDLILMCIQKQVVETKVVDYVCSVHNYIDMEDHVIRKGAIRAYEGERCVIPFNMRDGVAICMGKSNEDWNCSAPHGAGRVMSRARAKKELSVEEFKRQMEGIVSTSVGAGTIDEAPNAYKDTELIKSLIGDTVEILHIIKPLINLKDRNTIEE